MKLTWPGENLLIAMWKTLTDTATGNLLKPWQIRREGYAAIDVEKQRMLVMAQAERDAASIREGKTPLLGSARVVEPVSSEAHELVKEQRAILSRIAVANIADSVRREVNVAHAILFAEEQLKNESGPAPTSAIDPDWLHRWRDAAAQSSADELRHLWGRVLAGEVKEPGRFSLRSIEFLRDVSRREAELIQSVASLQVNTFLWANEDELRQRGLRFDQLLQLQELGVLAGVEGEGLLHTWMPSGDDDWNALAGRSQGLKIGACTPIRELQIKVYPLTTIGRDMVALCDAPDDSDYLIALGQQIHQRGYSVCLVDVSWQDEESISLSNERDLPTGPAVEEQEAKGLSVHRQVGPV